MSAKTKDYLVRWEIDAQGRTPRGAAQWALDIQRDQQSDAVIFDVTDEDGVVTRVDLFVEEAS